MSSNVRDATYTIRREFYLRDKYLRTTNRIHFLEDCLEEQVLPRSAPKALFSNDHPFTDTARAYLEDGIKSLKNSAIILKSRFGEQLPQRLQESLLQGSNKHKESLQSKLVKLCSDSAWQHAGKTSLINNMSKRKLTDVEIQALSLGLKFDTGKCDRSYLDLLMKNNKFGDSDVDKGFKQGVATCMSALARSNRLAMPRRYLSAIQELANDDSIVVTSADKGGGIVILDKDTYDHKMHDLLLDSSTYSQATPGTCKRSGMNFTKEARKILRRTESGKKTFVPARREP